MHCKIVKGIESQKLSIREWIDATREFENVQVTNKLKQQNPFTKEFIFQDVEGAGYWTPVNSKYTGWPGDGTVCFAPSGNGIVFIQFSDNENVELNEIASAFGGTVISHVTGS